jgi:hypothetical protein
MKSIKGAPEPKEDKMNAIVGMRSRGMRGCLAVLIAMTLAFAATPADACGCGIYLPLEGEASVSEEHVLIRWDGQTEDIIMTPLNLQMPRFLTPCRN